jgi:hypothetical protein
MGKQQDEIDFILLFLILWRRKKWIASWTLAFALAGLLYAILASPVYFAQATISLKDVSKGGDASKIFSQIGGVGGMVASQLGMGSPTLDKTEIILKGQELAERVVINHNLMPILFPTEWDSERGQWKDKDPRKQPSVRIGAMVLKDVHLVVTPELKRDVIRVGVNFRESVLAKRIVDFYLTELNNKIRDEVIKDAEANRVYLERQLAGALDPYLREKIQNMIAYEIERAMLASSRSIDILEKPQVPLVKVKPRRFRIVFIAAFGGLLFSVLSIFTIRLFFGLKARMSEYGI